MKRASLIAPLILILIGVLFLLNNIRPDLSVWRVVATYWPWVLVGWGALRIVEILYSWQAGQLLPKAGVNGGEWAFIIFLCFFGAGASAAGRVTNWPGNLRVLGWDMMGDTYDFPLHGEQSADGVKKIVLENLRGDARLVGGDGTLVKVDGRSMIRAIDRQSAERANKQAPLAISRQGDILYIRTSQERWSGRERLTAELDIAVPRNVAIECKGRNGDFDVTGVTGAVDIDSDNAGVRLNDVGSARIEVRRSDVVRASNVKGTVEVKGRGEIDGDDFTGPAKIVVRSQSRDIKLNNFTQALEIELDRGDIELAPGRLPLSAIDARTRSGSVTVSMPSKAAFQLSATTKRGEYENAFGAPLSADQQDRGGVIKGSTGTGPKVNVSTERGSITIRRNEIATPSTALTPAPPEPPASPKLPALPKPPKPEDQ